MKKVPKLKRLKDWRQAHKVVIEKHMALPFGWGTSDCLCLMLENAHAITGFDFYDRFFRSRNYSTAEGAQKLLLRRGYNEVADAIADYFPTVETTLARRGDLAICNVGGENAGGVFTSLGIMVKSETAPAHFLPVSSAVWAFKVGE